LLSGHPVYVIRTWLVAPQRHFVFAFRRNFCFLFGCGTDGMRERVWGRGRGREGGREGGAEVVAKRRRRRRRKGGQ
jgi:hypothetical protein